MALFDCWRDGWSVERITATSAESAAELYSEQWCTTHNEHPSPMFVNVQEVGDAEQPVGGLMRMVVYVDMVPMFIVRPA